MRPVKHYYGEEIRHAVYKHAVTHATCELSGNAQLRVQTRKIAKVALNLATTCILPM
jgi:hypothetical protein